MCHRLLQISVGLAFGAAMSHPALAATLCVGAGSGCHPTIGGAVTAAAPGDTIQVGAGTYHEVVVIDKALSLIGAGQRRTIIDALGLAYGVNVDGFNHPGLAHVVLTGFTIKNANLEGIFITNASDVTVRENEVVHQQSEPQRRPVSRPSAADSEAGEAFDCGEGIHLSAVDHSMIASNVVEHNAGADSAERRFRPDARQPDQRQRRAGERRATAALRSPRTNRWRPTASSTTRLPAMNRRATAWPRAEARASGCSRRRRAPRRTATSWSATGSPTTRSRASPYTAMRRARR